MGDEHKEHRQRMYKRLEKEGVFGFYDHELLEMLLYFSIPRGDTNPIAHNLLNSFNSIDGVMKADVSGLMSIEGLGPKSAMLIEIISELYRRCELSADSKKVVRINSVGDAVAYGRKLFAGKRYESFYVVCMDITGKVIGDGYLGEGTLDQVFIYTRKLIETALRFTAYSVVLMHNHPGGIPVPSEEDKHLTQKCRIALEAVNIKLLDHVIIADDDYYSFGHTVGLGSVDMDDVIAAAQKIGVLHK